MHQLAVNENLVRPDAVTHRISWIGGRCDLNLTPLLVRRDCFALRCEALKFLIDALFFDAALALNKG